MAGMTTSIADLRKSYERAELDESHVRPDPVVQFQHWFDAAVHAKALELGGTCEGAPGERMPTFYGAYFRDLDGNKFCVFKFV